MNFGRGTSWCVVVSNTSLPTPDSGAVELGPLKTTIVVVMGVSNFNVVAVVIHDEGIEDVHLSVSNAIDTVRRNVKRP